MTSYDLIVAGGGPAGSAAAYRAAEAGARVLLVDKATFPRDKACGDGLTPRAVRSIADLGLANELKAFFRVDGMRVHGAGRTMELPWPVTDEFPNYGYVAARTELDEMLLNHARSAGVEVWEAAAAREPIVEDGLVTGIVVRRSGSDSEVRASAVIAADGASSRLGRATGMVRQDNRPLGIAVRAHFPSKRADDPVIESYLEVRDSTGATLPAYGWVFPMGNGRINVGVGLMSTYKNWRSVNTADLMTALLAMLPAEWEVPQTSELRESGQLKGWRLPMAFAVKQPWRPGIIAVGDAAGVVNPFNGEGISEAVESGVAGAEAILQALQSGGPADLSIYERRLDELWGPYYRLGRTFARLIGHPALMGAAIGLGMRSEPTMRFAFKVLANLYQQSGGTMGDASMRALVKLATLIPAG